MHEPPTTSINFSSFIVRVWSATFSLIYVFLCRGGGGSPYFRSGLTKPGMGTRSCIDIHNWDSLMH